MCSRVAQDDTAPCTQPATRASACSCRSSTATSRTRASAAVTPTSSTWARRSPAPVSITGVQGQTGAITFNKRYCVPNSSGPAKKNDSTNRCWDLAEANLGANGKPAFNMARTRRQRNCDCQFIDWSHDTNGGHVPGYAMAQEPDHRPAPTRTAPAATRCTAARRRSSPARRRSASGGSTARTPAARTPSATWRWRHRRRPVPVLEPGARGDGGFFPLDPPAHGFPLYSWRPAGPGTPPQMVGTRGDAVQPVAVLVQLDRVRRRQQLQGDQYLFPPS